MERIISQTRLGADEIKEVLIRGLASYSTNKAWATAEPKDQYQGQFSLPYGVAMLALHLPAGPNWQQPSLAQEHRVREIMKRVRFETEPRIAAMMLENLPKLLRDYPTTVTITTNDGRVFTDATNHAKGDGFSAEWRMADDEVIQKFRINAEGVISQEKIDRTIETVLALENIDDINKLHDLFH